MQGQLKAALAVGVALTLMAGSGAAYAPKGKGKPKTAAPAPAPPPAPKVIIPQTKGPPELLARCAVARQASQAAEKGFMGKSADFLGSAFTGIGSSAADRFSISGRDGPFACSPKVAQRHAADRVREQQKAEADAKAKALAPGGEVRGKSLNLSAQADVRGSLRPTLFYMPETQRRLQAMVNRIADNWPYPNAPRPTVLISANVGFNAEARADNTIVVWLGVLADNDFKVSQDITDNDLYWLLGHEYSHAALDHIRSEEQSEKQRRFLHDATRVYQRGAMLVSSIDYAQANATNTDPALKIDYDDTKEAHERMRFMMDKLLYPVWGRMQEDEADAAGFDAIVLMGYYPRYDYSVQRFAASETDMNARIKGVQDNMAARADKVIKDPRFKESLQNGDFSSSFNSVYKALEKGLFEGVRKWVTELVSRNHRSAKARGDGLMRYAEAAYDKQKISVPMDLITVETDDIRQLSELKNGLIAAKAVGDAEAALNALPEKKAEAQQAIAIALGGPFKNEAYVRYYAARVDLAYGRTEEAIKDLEVARSAKYPSPEAYRELVKQYANTRRIGQARAVIAEGRKRTGDYDYFLPSDVRVLVRQQQMDALQEVFEACRASSREQIMLDCQSAALDTDYKNLTAKQKKQLEDLALWGETPKEQSGKKGPGWDPKSLVPWKKG